MGVEAILKIYYLGGCRNYTRDSFNVFDAFLVVISFVDIGMTYSVGNVDGFSAIIVFKALRLLRVVKLAKRIKSIQTLFLAIGETLKDIGYLAGLILLFLFI